MTTRRAIRDYHEPAGGWGALNAVAAALTEQDTAIKGSASLLRMNQPQGFDCPGCAWPDPKHTSSFEFCENGAKAVAWEATGKRCTPEFFAAHRVAELERWSDYDLEMTGRLTHPMTYDAAVDRYVAISWDDAFALVAKHLNALADPNDAEFYTSGRTSNEAAFLYQLFAREYGTNNFPDCSNMCHEATSVGLPKSLGVGKGTVLLEDFDVADAIFIFGQNPGTNSPRMMTSLRNASRRGARIISFNPLRERALERFQAPQSPVEMITLTSTPISTNIYQVRVGGDAAALKGIMKAVIEADDAALADDAPRAVDIDFINGHTRGFEDLAANVRAASWESIERQSPCRWCMRRPVARTTSCPWTRGGLKPNRHSSLSRNSGVGFSVIPTVRSPWTLEWPRTGHKPAPDRPMLPRSSARFQGYNARIRVPGGFHLTSTARERIWMTASGRANFLVLKGLEEDPQQADDRILWLTTIRSHDQYNTTIYSYSDRYRGVFGQRDIVLLNGDEMAKRGLSEGDRVDLVTASTDGIERAVRNIRVVRYKMPDGCCAAYYPETNPLVPLYARDPISHTPSSKAIPILVVPAGSKAAPRLPSDHAEAR